jgi:hypothetical protein
MALEKGSHGKGRLGKGDGEPTVLAAIGRSGKGGARSTSICLAPANMYAGWVGGVFPWDSEGPASKSWEGSLHVGEPDSEFGSVSTDQFRAQTKE